MRDGVVEPERVKAAAAAPAGTSRPVDARALARHAARLRQAPSPWLHEEVARRMAERLAVLRQPPLKVVDWGAHLGAGSTALRKACPKARHVAVEAVEAIEAVAAVAAVEGAAPVASQPGAAAARAAGAAPWWSARRWWPRLVDHAAAPHESTLHEGDADLLWSNMVLHHLHDPQAVFARWARLLAVDGILMFSTLGPGTLESLRRLYAARRWGPAHAPFVDMHDLGDMLVHAGFAGPVMDQEVLSLTWATPQEALAELRQLGGNADRKRHAGLRTPRWYAALAQALQDNCSREGRISLEFEIVYGHAVKPPPRARLAAETKVPLDDLRGMLRSRGGALPGSRGPTR